MAWIESIQKAINYMEDHLLEDISIGEISKQANASAFHFQRTFTILTDTTVGEYLRHRRLTLAAKELSTTHNKVIDLAYKYGYDTPEAFSKAFRRQHGVAPTEARKFVGKLKFYERLIIQVTLKGAEPMKYNVLERDSFKVVGIKETFSFANDENQIGIPKMWDEANASGTSRLLYSTNDGKIKGVLGVCVANKETSKELDYWIAAEVDGHVPEGLLTLEIPASKWVVFEVNGAMPDAMPKVWKQIFSEWFPSSGYQHAGTPELEVYPDGNPFSEDYYSEIWIPVE